jgi:hypothetical protein
MLIPFSSFAGALVDPATESAANPTGLAFTVLMGVLLVTLPRRYALIPIIVLTCFMSMGQAIVIMGFHFMMIRILVLFGWARLIVRREVTSLKFNVIDKLLIWWTVSSVLLNTLLWQTLDALTNRLGFAYNALGMYFLFRFLVRDFDDIKRVFKITAFLIAPLAAAMITEKLSGRNMFAVWGDVDPLTTVRDGVARCQGPFAHPILAGTFGATLLPFVVNLWHEGGQKRVLSVLAVISSTVIAVTSGSSGPILAYLAAVAALCMRPWRKYLPFAGRVFAIGLIALHLVMKAPVWFVIARIDIFSGSTGFHRAYLIDQAIAHFSDWWLLGTKSIDSWGQDQLHGDITNEYISQGVRGGLLTMVLFILIIVVCFRIVGRLQAYKDLPIAMRTCAWALGAALFAHVLSYLSVSYFDQNLVIWYLLLAMISSTLAASAAIRHRERGRRPHVSANAKVDYEASGLSPVPFFEVQ